MQQLSLFESVVLIEEIMPGESFRRAPNGNVYIIKEHNAEPYNSVTVRIKGTTIKSLVCYGTSVFKILDAVRNENNGPAHTT